MNYDAKKLSKYIFLIRLGFFLSCIFLLFFVFMAVYDFGKENFIYYVLGAGLSLIPLFYCLKNMKIKVTVLKYALVLKQGRDYSIEEISGLTGYKPEYIIHSIHAIREAKIADIYFDGVNIIQKPLNIK